MKDKNICPICGAPLDEENDYRCSRFPVCTYKPDIEHPFKFDETEFVVFDLETTGLDSRMDRIIEYGAVKVKGGEIVDRFSLLTNPGKTQAGLQIYISNEIANLTGITNKDLENQPTEAYGTQAFVNWVGDTSLVVGHNIDSFDIKFLKKACERAHVEFPFHESIDTMKMVRAMKMRKNGLIPNDKQPTLAKYFGIEYDAHRAVNDVEALYKIFRELNKEYTPTAMSITHV